MNFRFFGMMGIWLTLTLMSEPVAWSVESLSNHALEGITGQATALQSDKDREKVYTIETEVSESDTLHINLPKQWLGPSYLDSRGYCSVIMDFQGSEADKGLGVEAKDFHGKAKMGNIVYTNEDTRTSIILSGTCTGFYEVPSTFRDGLTEHDIRISSPRIPDEVVADYEDGNSDFILTYQGNTYEPEDITETGTSFTAMPNRQVQMVGRAGDKPLNILIPRGHGADTMWNVISTIPAGQAFVKVDVNRLINHNNLKYTVKIANNREGLNAGDPGSQPTDRSGTLGTLYMGGDGKTTIEPASIVITTFNNGET